MSPACDILNSSIYTAAFECLHFPKISPQLLLKVLDSYWMSPALIFYPRHLQVHSLLAAFMSSGCHFSPSEIWVRCYRDQSFRQPHTGKNTAKKKSVLPPPKGGYWELGCYLLQTKTLTCWGGVEARASRNFMRFPTVLNVAFSWLGIQLTALDLWLLVQPVSDCFSCFHSEMKCWGFVVHHFADITSVIIS